MAGARRSPVPGQVRIWLADADTVPFDTPGDFLVCLLGDPRPRPVRGAGGWGQSQRTGRRAQPRFDGAETPAYELALILEDDRVPATGPVTDKVRTLHAMTGNFTGDTPPPVLKWAANVEFDSDRSPRRLWVCESAEWGDSFTDDSGRLRWWQVTVTLAVFNDSTLELPASKGFARRDLHKTQDLRDFARKYLGDAKRWREVADLNRDNPRCPRGPHANPKRTVTLLVPPRESKSKRDK